MCPFCIVCILCILHTNMNSIRVSELCTKRTVLAHLNGFLRCISVTFFRFCVFPFYLFLFFSFLFIPYLYSSLMHCTKINIQRERERCYTYEESPIVKSHRKCVNYYLMLVDNERKNECRNCASACR